MANFDFDLETAELELENINNLLCVFWSSVKMNARWKRVFPSMTRMMNYRQWYLQNVHISLKALSVRRGTKFLNSTRIWMPQLKSISMRVKRKAVRWHERVADFQL